MIDLVTAPDRVAVDGLHHVAGFYTGLLPDNAAGLRTALGLGDPRVLLDPVHALDEDLAGVRVGVDDLALGALVLAGDDDDRVTLLDLHFPSSPALVGPTKIN